MTHRALVGVTGLVLVLAASIGSFAVAEIIAGLKPAEPEPAAQQLAPGLATEYTYAIMNHLDDFKGRKFEAGPPLPNLDHRMGAGTVLTSKGFDGVGAIITGFIQFETAGTYGFEVVSNDGVRVEIGGKLLYEEPDVHADSTSDRIDVKVDRPGWYPIKVMYFEKRNTATLILRWIRPGESGKPAPVPAKAFGHLKK